MTSSQRAALAIALAFLGMLVAAPGLFMHPHTGYAGVHLAPGHGLVHRNVIDVDWNLPAYHDSGEIVSVWKPLEESRYFCYVVLPASMLTGVALDAVRRRGLARGFCGRQPRNASGRRDRLHLHGSSSAPVRAERTRRAHARRARVPASRALARRPTSRTGAAGLCGARGADVCTTLGRAFPSPGGLGTGRADAAAPVLQRCRNRAPR